MGGPGDLRRNPDGNPGRHYWIPALLDHRYTNGTLFAKNLFALNFAPIFNFFVPNLLNDARLRTGNVPMQIGFFHVLIVILAILMLPEIRSALTVIIPSTPAME